MHDDFLLLLRLTNNLTYLLSDKFLADKYLRQYLCAFFVSVATGSTMVKSNRLQEDSWL